MNDTIINICKLIERAGGTSYIVGGSVRDSAMGNSDFKDCDMEVFGLNEDELNNCLKNIVGFDKAKEVGKNFGVIKFSSNGVDYDIAMPRRERKSGKGYKGFDIEVDSDMGTKEAASRRDFTINSMMFNPLTNHIVDHYNGIKDIDNKLLKHTTDRFDEDPLRVLRCMQFSSRLGFSVHEETIEKSKKLFDEYLFLNKSRVWIEWQKWSQGNNPEKGLSFLDSSEWINHYPELKALKGCPQDPTWHPEGCVWTHTMMVVREAARVSNERNLNAKDREVLIFSALCHDFGKPIVTELIDEKWRALGHCTAGEEPSTSFLESIGAPKDLINKVIPMVKSHLDFAGVKEPNKRNVNRLSNRLYPSTIYLWDALVEADKSGRDPLPNSKLNSNWLRIANEINVSNNKVKQVFLGRHLIEKGFLPTEAFGGILKKAFEIQIEDDITNIETIYKTLYKKGLLSDLGKKNECIKNNY